MVTLGPEAHASQPATVEAWARCYIETTSLAHKQAPGSPPATWQHDPAPVCLARPGRPSTLVVQERSERTPKPAALRDPHVRAKLLHTFWHHELQAAELMCWALLRFTDTETDFRRGLLKIATDEVRHMQLYQRHIEALDHRIGDFAVRDWFWERVPSVQSVVGFVALLGMGFEAANLEHSSRFAAWFRAAGDSAGAELQERIAKEEVAHVRFAVRWFERWTGAVDFDTWQAALPAPLSPLLMRGSTVDRALRLRASMPDVFVQSLADFRPAPRGRHE